MRSLFVVSIAVLGVIATPQIAFPFNSQVPPVARVDNPFNFTFSDTTFKPNGATFQYSISGGPAWLQFDAIARQLWGTPGVADAVTTVFNITASDGSGSAAMKCTLIVTTNPAPISIQDVSNALSEAGNMTGPSSLLAHPQEKFSIKFSTGSYQGNGKALSFYSTLADHTPLPSWMTFDGETLRYTGTPPKLTSSPQSFDVLLIASDFAGFAGVSDAFSVVVSNKTWAFEPEEQTINIAVGNAVNLDNLRSMLFLGDRSASQSDVQQAVAQVPAWLNFDSETLMLSGTPPSGMKSTDINVTAYDHSGDGATIALHLRFGSLLTGSIGPLTAYLGKAFRYTIDRSDFVEPDVSVSIDTGSASSWLHFDPKQLILSGTVPSTQSVGTLDLNMTVNTANHSDTDSSTIKLYIQTAATTAGGGSTASSDAAQSSTLLSSPTTVINATAGTIGHVNSTTKGEIAAVVICPIVGVIAIILIVLYCCKPRSREGKEPKSPAKSEISKPVATPREAESDPDLEKGELLEPFEPVADEHPPKLDVRLSPEKAPQTPALSLLQTPKRFTQRVSDLIHRSPGSSNLVVLEDGEAEALDGFNRSSWGYGPNRAPSSKPHDSMKVPTAMARVSKRQSARRSDLRTSTLSQHKMRQSKGYSRLPGRGHGRDSANCSSMGESDCVTGIGHGRMETLSCPYCPDTYGESGMPLQTHEEVAESSYGTEAPSMISSAQSHWPIPTTWQSNSASKIPKLSRLANTIRSAQAKTSGPASEVSDQPSDLPERRSLFDKRQSYIRTRAQMRSPFFASINDDTHSRRVSGTDPSTRPSGLGIKMSQPSLRIGASRRRLVREYSASSSLDPDTARGRRRSKSRWKLGTFTEGFPRALSARGWSKSRNSVVSSTRFEDASEAEWERRSVSIYSEHTTYGDAEAGAARSSRSSLRTPSNMPVHVQPATAPPAGPLPTPPVPDVPSKSPRRSITRPKSAVEDYPPDELPTIEKPELAIAVRNARLSQLAQGNKRRIDALGSKRKDYPDLKRSGVGDRPRSSYRSALATKREAFNSQMSALTGSTRVPGDTSGMAKERSWEEFSGNEAFI